MPVLSLYPSSSELGDIPTVTQMVQLAVLPRTADIPVKPDGLKAINLVVIIIGILELFSFIGSVLHWMRKPFC